MARHILPEAVTAEGVIRSCGGTVPPDQDVNYFGDKDYFDKNEENNEDN